MLMSDVLMWVAIASGFVVGLPALWMLGRGLWPTAFEKCRLASRQSLVLSFVLGLIPSLVFAVMIAGMAKRLGPVPGIIVSGVLILWGLMGAAGIAGLIGERLWPAGEPWRQTRNGGLVVICCALMPVVGWFLFVPLLAVVGMGVNVRCLITRRPPVATAMPAPAAMLDSAAGAPN
ncbi:MAG: hypothetical protein JWO94_730 [Verrucomicrobiaceae bacterium]|nr:hypothetical protein [Verrucomicrobiaceae bacterium]